MHFTWFSLSLSVSFSCCVSALATNGEFATKVKQKQQKEAATNADRDVDADEVLDEAAEIVGSLLCSAVSSPLRQANLSQSVCVPLLRSASKAPNAAKLYKDPLQPRLASHLRVTPTTRDQRKPTS